MPRKIEVLANREAIVARSLVLVLEAYESAVRQCGRFTIAVAGGSTPKPLYEAMANQPLDWTKVHVFWGDERYVPNTDPQSNEGMVRKAWLDRVSMPTENIHPMSTTAGEPEIDAANYEKQLLQFFGIAPGQFPQLDLVLLGTGDDGHTASLFPGTMALEVRDRLVTVGHKDGQPRLTLTVPCINQAKQKIFLADGAAKASALAAIWADAGDDRRYPARLIQGPVVWLVDKNAAGQ